ncbi:PAMP-induced secreted peptide 2-like [Mercurialis annua]|uniref:PAMP-induced secreted peptide 2-like n=1 Tax=Mercurialis annua TaxID=3986 RepID=UPI00215F8289|nr:PAMP-induced secreted peptide 2-like [Mercurialis annua]
MENLCKFLVIILIIHCGLLIQTESRPLNIKNTKDSAASRVIEGFLLDGLSLGAIKESGPSPGVGHKYTYSQTLGGIKDSGSSPGVGHKYTNSQLLGGIKNSGPSPGEGHNHLSGSTHQ